jgi:hypothetical protein
MESAKEITSFLGAGYSAFWIVTSEGRRARRALSSMIKKYKRKDGATYKVTEWDIASKMDPVKALEALHAADPGHVLFMKNFHFLVNQKNKNYKVLQMLENLIEEFRASRKCVIAFSQSNEIPVEIEKDFLPLDFPLPDKEETKAVIDHIIASAQKKNKDIATPSDQEVNDIIEASRSLTEIEMENIYARSLSKNGFIDPVMIGKHKNFMIERSGVLEVFESPFTFEDIRGYEKIKEFTILTVDHARAKGILIIGPPGCGKTYFMKCLAGEVNKGKKKRRQVVLLDFGKVFSKWQGESDRKIREAIKVINAIGSCIVIVDEFEKQFAGAGGSGELDSGTTRRVTGKWLEFMSERPEGIYIIGTCNSFRGIPPEYLRPGRWDASPFYVPLPDKSTKEDILTYHCRKKKVEMLPDDEPTMEKYTGADIEAMVNNASMMEIPLVKAQNFVIPQAITMEAEISALEQWAEGRCIPAAEIQLNGLVDDSEKAERDFDL